MLATIDYQKITCNALSIQRAQNRVTLSERQRGGIESRKFEIAWSACGSRLVGRYLGEAKFRAIAIIYNRGRPP